MEMKLLLELLGQTYPVTVRETARNIYDVVLGEQTYRVDYFQNRPFGGVSLLLGTRSLDGWADQVAEGYRVTLMGESLVVGAEDPLRAGLRRLRGAGAGEELIRAPMPGVVVEVKAPAGAVVGPGQPVVIVEAMKMFNEFGPRRGGRVARVMVAPGQAVEKGQELALVVPLDGEAGER